MDDRYDRLSNPQRYNSERDDEGYRQAQQWDQTPAQAGDTMDRDDYRVTRRFGTENRDRDRSRGLAMQDRQQAGGFEGSRSIAADYRDNRGYGRFTSDSYGGRDYAYRQDPSYGYRGAGTAGYGASYGAGGRADYDHDRGFFERAGDEIASWFGDDDAARRREQDHRGVGPQNYARSDQRILDDICDKLTDDRYVDASDITVTVQEREVTLDGTVTSKQAKRRAEDVADNVSGVGHVQNNLRVKDRRTTDERPAL
ncbi:BON domain-containing protein [Croceicoccus sp. BE223]|uniref:BON domain-containing protein n=1 Tax=Croceicoccus sp. BE223 TaxID=2817716 RepID=UPI0028648160|nr:BON domain-containing protein [Croceicoccus sp. BE223]MDR7101841.1 osmotically-inducible protein OsmY [Croceicoccus sp. BE223]